MLNKPIYVTLSGQIAIDKRMTTLANNIANAGTVGFRAEEMKFESVLSLTSRQVTAFASPGSSYVSERHGGMNRTGNPLDLATAGQGYFALQTPNGAAYTRDGRMQMTPAGDLVSVNGYAMLDAGGAPLQVDPAGGEVTVSRDGQITQAGRRMGTIGLFTLDLSKGYTRTDNQALVPAVSAEPVVTFGTEGVMQGYVEESNVDAISEMTSLIRITRGFESLQSALDEGDNALKKAIQTLGDA